MKLEMLCKTGPRTRGKNITRGDPEEQIEGENVEKLRKIGKSNSRMRKN